MANQKLSAVKRQLIDYVEFCYDRNPDYEVSFLINNFLFDHITEMRELNISEKEAISFVEYSTANKGIEVFVKSSLACFLEKYYESRTDTVLKYKVPKSTFGSVENIFLGLAYSGNNDTDYKNLPSALSLCTFKI